MKWFLITLAVGLAASDKLDRTYLPPPGAQFSGGNLGQLDVPLETPHLSGPASVVGANERSQTNFGLNADPVNFGDTIPKVPLNNLFEKVPVTTTSFAFSQTTTFPPAGSYETTALPINPVTGLPVQLAQDNYPYGPSQGQQNVQNLPGYTQNQGQNAPTYGTNIESDFGSQGPTSGPVTNGSPNFGQVQQPQNQYPGQTVIKPEGTVQIPESIYQLPGQNQNQYPDRQSNIEQHGIFPTGAPGNQYYGRNVVTAVGTIQIPGGNQGLVQYPGGHTITGQQDFAPSTMPPTSLQPIGNQYGINYDVSQGQIIQETYAGQPISVQNLGEPQTIYESNQNQESQNVEKIPSQYTTGNQDLVSGPRGPENEYQPGSPPPNIPISTTPVPGVPSSTSAYSSIGPVYRPERPQAASDRNAVILNYENVRTPNGYSYRLDTSNGIHADESGIVDNGTKAQGSYSYIGDGGKVYSVTYTADENGFQPRGDHLPTPPPIPEAIKKVIEQAARDKAAGIYDDGSYDEAKYGDRKYQGAANRRRPHTQDAGRLKNKQVIEVHDEQIKPIVGINDGEYDEGIQQSLFNNFPNTDTTRKQSEKTSTRRPSNQNNDESNTQYLNEGNGSFSGDHTSLEGSNKNVMPVVEDGTSQLINYETNKQAFSGRSSTSTENKNQNNQFGLKNHEPSGRLPEFSGVTDTKTKYPDSRIDNDVGGYSENAEDKYQDIDSISSGVSNDSDETIYDSVTGTPIVVKRKQILKQRIKGNQQPSNNKNSRPQNENFTQASSDSPLISDYIKNAANQPISNQGSTKLDDTGYHYQQPNTKFEQNTFPTRFSPQKVSSSMKQDQQKTVIVKSTTRKPFITPNVYNQNEKTSQTTTRRPFTIIGVSSPSENSYTDYEDGNDYEIDENIDDTRINSPREPTEKSGVASPFHQSTLTISRPQYNADSQRRRVTQTGTVPPRHSTEYSETPGYKYGPTTPMPFQNSRFGSTKAPQKMKQRIPSSAVAASKTAVGRPVTSLTISETIPSDYKYQNTGPVSEYSSSNVVSGYPTTGVVSGLGSVAPTSEVSSTTYRPQDYYSTTAVPTTTGYNQGFRSEIPSRAPETSQDIFHPGYHYGPPKSDYSTNSDFFTPGRPGVSSTPGYQSTYQQGSGGFPTTTSGFLTPGSHGNFILSQPNTAPESSPFGTYQGNFQNGPSTSEYAATIVSSAPGGKPVIGYPDSPGATNPSATTDHEYGPSRPTYFATESTATIGTTPGSFIPSGTPDVPFQGSSTTYRPGSETTKDTFTTGPLVDGFGRPITIEQGGLHPRISTGPEDNLGTNYNDGEQSTAYPGFYDQAKFIGEDFRGPKQPQRYNPKTGYHYK